MTPTTRYDTHDKFAACSPSLVRDRSISIVCNIQLSCGHVYLTLRGYPVHCPLQFVFAVHLVRTLERLTHHGELRRAIGVELCCHLDGASDLSSASDVLASHLGAGHLPLTQDQALRTGAAARCDQSQAGWQYDIQLRIHVVPPEVAGISMTSPSAYRRARRATTAPESDGTSAAAALRRSQPNRPPG